MKVACPNCGQPQETAVDPMVGASRARCAECGTSFLVRIKQKQKPGGDAEEEKGYAWFVRKPDGTVFSFPGDRQLHEGIRRGFVALVDEISADSTKWTTIQALPVLAAFMQSKAEPEATAPEPKPASSAPPAAPRVRLDSPQAPTLQVPAQPQSDVRDRPTVAMETVVKTGPVASPAAILAEPLAPAKAPEPAVLQAPVARESTPSLTSAPLEHRQKDDPEWAGEWGKKPVDPDDMTGLTLHIKKRRQYLALAVVGALMLLVGLIAVRALFFSEPAAKKAPAETSQDPIRTPRSPAPDVSAPLGAQDIADAATDVVGEMASGTADVFPADPDLVAALPDVKPASDTAFDALGADVVASSEVRADGVVPVAPDVAGAGSPTVDDVASAPTVPTPPVPVTPPAEAEKKPAEAEKKPEPREVKQRPREPHSDAAPEKEKPAPPPKSKDDDEEDVSGSYDSLMSKGEKLRRNGDLGKAIKVFDKARSLKPTYAEPNYKLAECYRLTGKCGSAVTYYDKAISISGFRNAYIGIAKCYRQSGDTAKARQYLEQGIDKYNDGIMKLMLEKL
jgi:hypothetical protein